MSSIYTPCERASFELVVGTQLQVEIPFLGRRVSQFFTPLNSEAGFIGWIKFESALSRQGKTIYVATELRPAAGEAPPEPDVLKILSAYPRKRGIDPVRAREGMIAAMDAGMQPWPNPTPAVIPSAEWNRLKRLYAACRRFCEVPFRRAK
jgi:hypothetical protein